MILRGVLGLGVAKSAHLKGNDEFDLRLLNTGTKDSKTQYFINPLLGVRNSPARTSRAGDASRRGSLLGIHLPSYFQFFFFINVLNMI